MFCVFRPYCVNALFVLLYVVPDAGPVVVINLMERVMPNLDRYLDDAAETRGLTSDRELSRFIGTFPSHVSQYRQGRAYPSVERIIKIAELGNHDTELAVLDLLEWKCDPADQHTSAVIARLRKFVQAGKRAATVAALVAVVAFSAIDTKAAELGVRLTSAVHETAGSSATGSARMYIMGKMRHVLRHAATYLATSMRAHALSY